MASVQARHSRLCAREGTWTPARQAGRAAGCSCRPMFYVVFRDGAGRLVREKAGPNRQRAERRSFKLTHYPQLGEPIPRRDSRGQPTEQALPATCSAGSTRARSSPKLGPVRLGRPYRSAAPCSSPCRECCGSRGRPCTRCTRARSPANSRRGWPPRARLRRSPDRAWRTGRPARALRATA